MAVGVPALVKGPYMANNTDEILVGIPNVNGGVLMSAAPLEKTAYPTDAVTAVDASLKVVGFVSEDGVTESTSRNVDKIKAWGGQTVRIVQQDYETTYKFTFLQFKNIDVLKAVYGEDNVTLTSAGKIAIKKNAKILEKRSFVFEMKDGDATIRVFVPNGQIIEVGDVKYDHKSAIQLDVTVEAFPDADGNNAYVWTDDASDATP